VALWEEKGYDETTVEEIAAAANVSWSTFYFHFPRKETLLVELAGGAAEGVARDMEKVSLKSSLEDALTIFTEGVCRRALRIPRPVLAMVAAANIAHIGNLGGNMEHSVHFGTTLEPWLERAQVTGEIASDGDIKELSAIFVSMTMEAMLRWAMSNTSQQELADVFGLRRQIFLHGLQLP
jgi:AcrR family transcriptional regulator